jgi:hypothetical protein
MPVGKAPDQLSLSAILQLETRCLWAQLWAQTSQQNPPWGAARFEEMKIIFGFVGGGGDRPVVVGKIV